MTVNDFNIPEDQLAKLLPGDEGSHVDREKVVAEQTKALSKAFGAEVKTISSKLDYYGYYSKEKSV